ncbi:MAG: amino acid ABC transporter permease, partial [Deltaproteobacteria bacterium]|nr:amino acid ABC transporter permease [Deltaproteobacteria bacterium]
AVPELMYKARWIASKTFKYVEIYFIVALLYLVFALLFSYAMRLLERKLYIPGVTVIRRTTF